MVIKLVAKVERVVRAGIHKMGSVGERGEIRSAGDLPLPSRVEIEFDAGRDGSCTMYRYTDCDVFCGDTWHEDLAEAFGQANFEYGLSEKDFVEVGGEPSSETPPKRT